MKEANTDLIDQVVAISDPSDRNRKNHLVGDRIVVAVGNTFAWLFPVLMVAIVSQIFLRKAGMNQAWLDDAQWWIYGSALLTGFGYAITTDSHVRVDILHEHYSVKKKAKIEIFGLGWLLLPFLLIMIDILTHYAYASFVAREGSDSANGLHRLYLLKMLMPVLFGVAILAALTALKRNVMALTTPKCWNMILAGFPAAWFAGERLVHYLMWWSVRLTNSEIQPRRISREPMFDYTMWVGLGLVILIFAISLIMARRNTAKA